MLAYLPDGLFWFAVCGAGTAAIKHLVAPVSTLAKLTPKALTTANTLSPEALFWGGYAFSALNFGFFTVGAWVGYSGSQAGKQAVLLGTGALFQAFALCWFTKGKELTGNPNPVKQGCKIAILGALFLLGFFITPN